MRRIVRQFQSSISGVLAILALLTSCQATGVSGSAADVGSINKGFNRADAYAPLPARYAYTDYRERASAFHELIFAADSRLAWHDRAYNTLGIAAYVGDGRFAQDGSEEAVTVIAAVLSACLNGFALPADALSALNAFFSADEGVVLNNPNGRTKTTSFWYLLYPALLYTQVALIGDTGAGKVSGTNGVSDTNASGTGKVSDTDSASGTNASGTGKVSDTDGASGTNASDTGKVSDTTAVALLRQNALTTIANWYAAYTVIRDTALADFAQTGFDFSAMTPYQNGVWKEPDAAVGMAALFYIGYQLSGEGAYLTAAIALMDYIEAYFGGPLYEILLYYAPVLMARLNVLHGTNYDITRALNRVFDGNSIPRGGWGSIAGEWGDYEVNGLFGSKTDGGGYAFAMNTFAAAGAVAPLVRYDARYAYSVGKWLLHLHSNARYFFPDATEPENQSLGSTPLNATALNADAPPSFNAALLHATPYEGIRRERNGKSPWFGGDPTVYGWAETDLSLYSGAHTGVLGALFERTDHDGILRVDLCATDLFAIGIKDSTGIFDSTDDAFPTCLIYNPYPDERRLRYPIRSAGLVDLFDTVSNTLVAGGVSGETTLVIPADGARVIVELPASSVITRGGISNSTAYIVDGRFISSEQFTVSLPALAANQRVPRRLTIQPAITGNGDIAPTGVTYTLIIDERRLAFTGSITINTRDFGSGAKQVRVEARTAQDLSDSAEVRLIFQ
jgi:hypothetical protein